MEVVGGKWWRDSVRSEGVKQVVCVCVTAGVHHRGAVAGGRRERFGSEAVFRLGRKRSNEPIYQKR